MRWLGAIVAILVPLTRPVGAALPDLVPEAFDVSIAPDAGVDPGDVVEGCAGGASGRTLLRFSLRTRNQGGGDLVLGDPGCPDCATNPGAACANPLYVCAPAHGHPHFEGYAMAELVAADGTTVAVGRKIGFCVLDLECATPQFTCSYQGLSAGCADVYLANLPCQYIDLTGVALAPGDYRLRVTVDPDRRIDESDESNNTIELPLRLDCDTAGDVLPVCAPNPFLCYATSMRGAPEHRLAPPPSIEVRGTLGMLPLSVVRPRGLCTPAGAGSDARADPAIDLRTYTTRSTSRDRPPAANGLRIVTQLGTSTFDVVRLDGYAVPAVTDPATTPTLPVASEHTTDRFACFRVRVPRAARVATHAIRLAVGDRFVDPPATLVVKKPRRLCTPVATSGRPMRRATRYLLCHDVGPARAPHARAERVHDELATRTIDLGRPDEICLLAEKNPPIAVHEDLTPCSATVDVWRFDARAGAPVDVDVDTTDATTAADLCAELSCEGLSVAGNDERTCSVAPPAHGCPRLHGVPTGDGACVVTVRTCGPCADAARAQYALRTAVGGEDAPTTLITDDAAVAP